MLIDNILMSLPIRDAARTSVLSTQWRFNWVKIPQLILDHRLCKGQLEFSFHIWRGDLHKLPVSLFSYSQLTNLELRGCIFKPRSTFKGSEEGIKEARTSNMIELFNFPTCIENLHVDYYFMKCLTAGTLPPSLNDLKVLRLSIICFDDVEECVLFLIGRCHNLRKVTFDAFHHIGIVSEHVKKFYKNLGTCKSDTTFHQIQQVEMQLISGSWSELEFIKFLLAKSLMVEKLIIVPNFGTVAGGGLRLLKEVPQTNAEIIFKD